MQRPGLPDAVNLFQASKICGVSYRFLRRLFKEGKFPGRRHPVSRFVMVRRVDLIAWMVKHDYPPEAYRANLQPASGHLFAIGIRKGNRYELRGCNPTFLPSVLALGMRLATDPCWGVLVGFEGIGRDRAFEVAAELRAMKDCPLLIAIAGEDEATRGHGDPTRVFDQTYTEPLNYLKLAEAMRRLYKGTRRAWPRVADPGAVRFYRVGGRK